MSHRIGFDPNLPLVAGTDFSAGEVAFKVGDVVDWKTAGITEQIAFDWWRSGMIYHPIHSPAPTALPAATAQPGTFTEKAIEEVAADSQTVPFKMTPGETVHVPPPAKPKKR
ncbi:MAG: hypothetical protein M3R55_10245 [Acidobacteriota bacterium]|nr:hypothetical protein [Acidobacteriota bacterium]